MAWQPTSVFLPGESHGQRSLAGYNPWGRKDLDTPEATYRTQAELHLLLTEPVAQHTAVGYIPPERTSFSLTDLLGILDPFL